MANRDPEPAYPHQQFSQDYLHKNGPQKPLGAEDMPENQTGVVEVPVVVVEKLKFIEDIVVEEKVVNDSALNLMKHVNDDEDDK